MLSPGFYYLLLSVLLFAVGVVVHFHSANLSLPVSSVLTILTTILPLISFLNAFVYPSLLLRASRNTTSPSSLRFVALLPQALQAIQALATAALATLLLERTVPSPGLSCSLESRWSSLFRAADGRSIRRIQDTLDCCGFNSVRDRAFPFGQPSRCAEVFGRDDPCAGVYRGAMQLNSGLDLAVVVCVGLMQIAGLLAMRAGTNWWTAWRTRVWAPDMVQPEAGRPLLGAPDVDEDVSDAADEEGGSRSYGGTDDNRPRVEPSTIHSSEQNAWNDH